MYINIFSITNFSRVLRDLFYRNVNQFMFILDQHCYSHKLLRNLWLCAGLPVDTGRKLNVHKTFKRRPRRLLNVFCTFNLRPVSTVLVCI